MPAEGGRVLDLAAGGGRHSVWFLDRGHDVTALDRKVAALRKLRSSRPRDERRRLEIVEADLEDGSPWPLRGRRFDAIVVANYLHRPLFPDLLRSLQPRGVLLYDTFAVGNERYGKPSNPDFLLQSGELLSRVGSLQVVAFEQGLVEGDNGPAVRQRIAAVWGSAPLPLAAA
ncbi:MAG: class I SAM-dependent methyltransferase [Alphaproteobacteria bacterium]